MTFNTQIPGSQGLIHADTPVGFVLDGVKKKAAIQLMGSRLWGRFNPNHWDPVYAAETGLAAPIQTGEMSSAYISEMCVNYFGANFFEMRASFANMWPPPWPTKSSPPMASSPRKHQKATAIDSRLSFGLTTSTARRKPLVLQKSMWVCKAHSKYSTFNLESTH